MKNELELIGDDCALYTGKAGAEQEGDGTKTLDVLAGGTAGSGKGKGIWIITAIAASNSIWPEGMKVGEAYPALGTEVLADGDKAKQLTLTEVADASGWSFTITRDKIETSRLKHTFKKYRYGKKDGSGSIKSIFTQGVTDQADGLVGNTMKLFTRDASGTVTVHIPEDKSLYFVGYVRKTEVAGEVEDFMFAEIRLSNITLGGDTGSAQSYDSEFSLTGIDPVFYSVEVVGGAA